MKLTMEHFEVLFGRRNPLPDDEMVLNGQLYKVVETTPDGVTFDQFILISELLGMEICTERPRESPSQQLQHERRNRMSRKLTFDEFKRLFGRPDVQPGDALGVNDQVFEVASVDPHGITFTEVNDEDMQDGEDEGGNDGDQE